MYTPIIKIDNKAKLTQLGNRAEITVSDDIIYKGELISLNGGLATLKLDNGQSRTFIVD